MKAVEFDTTLGVEGQIALPANVGENIPVGQKMRVVLMWDEQSSDSLWREAGRRKFEEAYCEADAVYEQLLPSEQQ